ncbi:MAG TPA: hypothetical protein VLM79_30635 [Kofleriaceae bacterium]|nr:hypothetical protein [Kofleriaceae bacterium]
MRSVLVQSFTALFAIPLASPSLCGCGGAAPAPSVPVASSASVPHALEDPAIAEPPSEPSRTPARPPGNGRRLIPRPGPLTVGPVLRDVWMIDPQAQGDPVSVDRWLRLPTMLDVSNKKSDFWSPCVREFVQGQPETARDVLGEALSLYSTACTGGPSGRVEFQTPRADRTAPAQSSLGLVGALERNSCELALRAAYHGPPVRAERLTLIADGVRWSSPRIDFDDDDGWEIATLPLTRELARVVMRAAEARDALLRFEAGADYEDVVLTEDMKQDLRAMLDALDAIHRP